jgi:hypothetical protein
MTTDMQSAYYAEYRHTAAAGFTEDQRELLNSLATHGRSTKAELTHRLGWGERKVRKTAEMLKRLGIPVMASSGTGSGYWLSTDIDEIASYIAHELESRIASLEEQRAALTATERRLRVKLI